MVLKLTAGTEQVFNGDCFGHAFFDDGHFRNWLLWNLAKSSAYYVEETFKTIRMEVFYAVT